MLWLRQKKHPHISNPGAAHQLSKVRWGQGNDADAASVAREGEEWADVFLQASKKHFSHLGGAPKPFAAATVTVAPISVVAGDASQGIC